MDGVSNIQLFWGQLNGLVSVSLVPVNWWNIAYTWCLLACKEQRKCVELTQNFERILQFLAELTRVDLLLHKVRSGFFAYCADSNTEIQGKRRIRQRCFKQRNKINLYKLTLLKYNYMIYLTHNLNNWSKDAHWGHTKVKKQCMNKVKISTE